MDETPIATIQALVEPIVAEQDMELVELACRPQGGQTLVRLLVDKVGGVTIQQCARVNQLIGHALEANEVLGGSYTIEVSSPGLDRPLITKRDFERALGETVRLVLNTDDGRTKETDGIVLAVQLEAIVLKTVAGNVTFPLTQIRMAKKAIPW